MWVENFNNHENVTSGTMSGGGRTVMKGRMGQSVTVTTTNQRDLDAVENELKLLEERFRYLRERQTALENQIKALEPELQQMKMNYEIFGSEIKVMFIKCDIEYFLF